MNACRRILFGVLLCLAACGDRADNEDHTGNTAETAEFVGCPDTIPAFSFGMSTTSGDGRIAATLLKSSPVPPARFFNDWTVEFESADDAPLEDVTLRSVRAFMPVHGHYGTPDPRLTQHEDEPAVFDLDALNLFMRGPWQIKLAVSSPSSGQADLIFDVCVEE
jgi:hypothetical protein